MFKDLLILHDGQTDKAGAPYINHLNAVADGVKHLGHNYYLAGLLHDILEDTVADVDLLKNVGVPSDVINAVVLLTKVDGVPYDDYITKIKADPIACAVKISDMNHNKDLTRLAIITLKDLERADKYKKAIKFLES